MNPGNSEMKHRDRKTMNLEDDPMSFVDRKANPEDRTINSRLQQAEEMQ